MPIAIRESPEPRSDAARTAAELLLVSSDAAEILQHELRRYCRREINGRSFLIAGHRGAGKTTLVESAWLTIWKESEEGKTLLRPLLVSLHGPSLFTSAIQPAPAQGQSPPNAPAAAKAAADKTSPAGGEAGTPAASPTADDQTSASKASPPTSELQTVLEQIILALHRAVSQEFARDLWQRKPAARSTPLVDITNPFLSLVDKFGTALVGAPPRDEPSQRFELAAQFEAELYESPDASRLRDLYARVGAIPDGILRRRNGSALGDPAAGARAWRELVALAAISDAYRLLSSKVDESLKQTDEGEEAAKRELALDSAKANLFAPLYSLLAGGLVGVGTGAATNSWFAGAMSGLVTALGSAFVVRASHTRSRTQTSVRQLNIVIDRRPATLDRVLPIFVSRLLDAGLAPLFVVDELDKVDKLDVKMKEMVHHLKKLVAENAFFCFLADREYFESMARKRRQTAYAVEYTYFTHDLFVVFSPRSFHEHLTQILYPDTTPTSTPGQDDVDCEVLPYVLLHRSRMHAIDVRRALSRWRTAQGFVDLTPGEVVTDNKYRLDVLLQLAIEASLESDKFRERLTNDPELLRLAFDAMYYVTRRWVRAHNEEQQDGGLLLLDDSDAAKKNFEQYLIGRMRTEDNRTAELPPNAVHNDSTATRKAAAKPKASAQKASTNGEVDSGAPAPPAEIVRFLYARVQDVALLLADPKLLASEVTKWNKLRKKKIGGRERLVVGQPVLHAAGLDYGEIPVQSAASGTVPQPDEAPVVVLKEPFFLLDKEDATAAPHRYRWRYAPDGTELFIRPAVSAPPAARGRAGAAAAAWRKDASYIRSVDEMLKRLTSAGIAP